MLNNLREELFKFKYEKIPTYSIAALIIFMCYSLFQKTNLQMITMGLGAIQWIPIILVGVGSSFFAMEYDNNTMFMMIYKSNSKLSIYLSKFLIVCAFSIVLIFISTFFTILSKEIFMRNQYGWLTILNNQHSLIENLLLNLFGTLIYCFFIIALSFMLIMLIRVNAAVIGVGLAVGFIGGSVSSALMEAFPNFIAITKWNPLNMIFVGQQFTTDKFIRISHLSNFQIAVANCTYGILFLVIGYFLFKKRRV